jgi:hypothetical protein
MLIICEGHGEQTAAIVCRHHMQVDDHAVGFIENSDDPDDLQAWCDDCERMFLQEGDKTNDFRVFNDFAVVCSNCYVDLRTRHHREPGET